MDRKQFGLVGKDDSSIGRHFDYGVSQIQTSRSHLSWSRSFTNMVNGEGDFYILASLTR